MAVRPARRRSSSPTRQFQWARLRQDVTFPAGEQVSRVDMLATWLAEVGMTAALGVTVMRVRGLIHCRTLVGSGAFQAMRFAAVRRYERGVAAAGADGPFTTEHDDWFLWEPMLANDTTVNGIDVNNTRYVDVKAARRLTEARHELQMWVHQPAGAVSTVWYYDLSVGVKLP